MRIGISASAVFSETDRLDELLRPDTGHIEIGIFETQDVADSFVRRARARGKTIGIHSPLLRGNSKNNLIEPVTGPVEDAWLQVERELEWGSRVGIDYLLCHFPYAPASGTLTLTDVRAAVLRLSRLSEKTGVRVVCEPKLGDRKDPAGIGWLRTAPTSIFSRDDVSLCWDVGDHLMAHGGVGGYLRQFERWKHAISVVHLHNVRHVDEFRYRWVPPHPNRSVVDGEYDLGPIIRRFRPDTLIVFEYTPQAVTTHATVNTSYNYLKVITEGNENA